jgi:hypothetical protein
MLGGRTAGRVPAERQGNGEQDRPVDDAVAGQQVVGSREQEDDDDWVAEAAEDGQADPNGPEAMPGLGALRQPPTVPPRWVPGPALDISSLPHAHAAIVA